jgi:murein DD-endopeptidase MepM/ murein hydrolase activator NlpD
MMRFSRSGHLERTDELEQKRLERVALPQTRLRLIVASGALAVPVAIAAAFTALTDPPPPPPVVVESPPVVVAPPPPPPDPTLHDVLLKGEALGSALARHGVSAEDVADLVTDIGAAMELRSLRAGAPFSVRLDDGRLTRFSYKTRTSEGVPRLLIAERLPAAASIATVEVPSDESAGNNRRRPAAPRAPRFAVTFEDAAVVTVVEGLVGNVRGSLYNGMLEAGGDAQLVNRFVDVFAWNVDFYRQSQPGDEFRLLVEKRYAGEGAERTFLGWGKVLAAEYINAGRALRGFTFHAADGGFRGVFDELGESLERTFLKSPLEITKVTSSYGSRFHPVLKTQRVHEGVDYGAPIGTPVWSVADGVVVEARYHKGAGNMVVVNHAGGLKTEYFHLSRFAEGLKPGSRVLQKQVIGFVGSTGMSTGPHLHFGMRRGGRAVDPGRQEFPAATPMPPQYRAEFDATVQPLLAQLQALTRA